MLSKLWMGHSNTIFPKGYGGIDVNGICVSSLTTNAAGCISSYIKHNDQTIDLKRHQILKKCKSDLETVLKYTDGEALNYFSQLHSLCRLVLDEACIA